MEKGKRTLFPEWLRSNGTVGNSAHHGSSPSSNSDVSSLVHHGRHRNSRKVNDFDSSRSTFFDRTHTLNSGRSSSNVSGKHAYSSFSRNHRDKDRERDKERMSFGDHWDCDSFDPLESMLTSRFEKDTLRRSHSMVYRKQGEPLPRRTAVNSGDNGNSNQNIANGFHSGGNIGSSIHKAEFENDFPSLGTEERQGVSEIARVSSPVFGSASQSVPVGNSALIDGEGWTSALADAPSVVGSSSTGSSPAPQTVSTTSSGAPSVTFGLNMAEALAQTPSRTSTAPLVLNSTDKSKVKPATRTSEMNIAVKSGSQTSPLIYQGNHSPHNGHVKSDPKTSGKLLVLKPGRDNGVSSPTQKDISSSTKVANNRDITSQHAVAPVNSVSARNTNVPKLSAGEYKAAAISAITGFTVEKRHSLAQTQSRNDFFNLLKKKKKTSTNISGALSNSDSQISSSVMEKSEVTKEVIGASVIAYTDDGTATTSNGDTCSGDKKKEMSTIDMPYPNEEEAAFLCSLGWEEGTGEDEGLTEDEINAFYQKHMKIRPSLKIFRGMQPMLLQSVANNLDGVSSESSLSDSASEA
ncbi:serine-rich adhesin for platelets-like [Hibiscus syriacus]|uniref:serine-rich adhesin for platelets-like n=1 Tax=Hibiscus syriacus TaxID=106335 RepID=UPI00192104A7|nr:serine-rich adhesin for platelets-like [Hibiscus syriacus]